MDTIETEMDPRHDGEEASFLGERGLELARRLFDRVEALVRERPGAALLGALGLGFVIGRIVRR